MTEPPRHYVKRQTQKDKYCMISLSMWNLKIQQTREYDKKEEDSLIQRTNQWLPMGRGEVAGAIQAKWLKDTNYKV